MENPEGPGIWGRNQREVQNTAQNSEPTSDSAVRLVAVHPNVRLWTDRRAGSFGEVDGMNERERDCVILCENLACLDANTRSQHAHMDSCVRTTKNCSSLWMKNALDNTEKSLNKLQNEARKGAFLRCCI